MRQTPGMADGTDGEGWLRARLVEDALRWAEQFGVAPGITGAISEYDAAVRIVGMTEEEYALDCRTHTAVTKGYDFTHNDRRYQVKANRASGKPGSNPTLLSKVSNHEWDILLWLRYDPGYVLQEAWEWPRDRFIRELGHKERLRPNDIRKGRCVYEAPKTSS